MIYELPGMADAVREQARRPEDEDYWWLSLRLQRFFEFKQKFGKLNTMMRLTGAIPGFYRTTLILGLPLVMQPGGTLHLNISGQLQDEVIIGVVSTYLSLSLVQTHESN